MTTPNIHHGPVGFWNTWKGTTSHDCGGRTKPRPDLRLSRLWVDQLVRVLPNWFLVQPPPYPTVACIGDMLRFIVCFVSLPGPDETWMFEWIDAWHRGFVDSLSHRQRTSIPFFGECWRLDRLVLGVIHRTEQRCFAFFCWAHCRWHLQSQKAAKHNRMSFRYHVDDMKNHILIFPQLKFIAELSRN